MPSPYKAPFPRQSFVARYGEKLSIHPFQREAHESYFRSKNPRGFRHDLGAQDTFLDNWGLLFTEQLRHARLTQYFSVLSHPLLPVWERLRRIPLKGRPWWDEHFNSAQRSAVAGEPRGLLRFLREVSCSALSIDEPEGIETPGDSQAPMDFERLFEDWSPEPLLPPGADFADGRTFNPHPLGVVLPEEMRGPVADLRLLHPRESTPDLSLRSGMTAADSEIYLRCVRDQGGLGTCVAQAVAAALDVATLRGETSSGLPLRQPPGFSAAWIHDFTPGARNDGRRLKDAIDLVVSGLPCTDEVFRYPLEVNEQAAWRVSNDRPNSESMLRSSAELARRCGRLQVRRLGGVSSAEVWSISTLKAHLAAGWTVVASAAHTREMHDSGGFVNFGTPATPIPGDERIGGHTWVLIGYDHVDGNQQWKYQGRFFALNSWGRSFPGNRPFGHGVVALPFAFFLTEGIEAYGLKFKRSG